MISKTSEKSSQEIKEFVIQGIQEKKGNEIIDLDLSGIENSVCNDFIICHGNSKRQVEAIAVAVEDTVKKNAGINPWHKEGYQNAEWILLDYVDVVVHVFNKPTRNFYNLEGLWADANPILIKE